MIRTLVARGADSDVIGLELADLSPGDAFDRRTVQELVGVVLSGTVAVTIDGRALGVAGGRRTVFEGPGHAVYAPPGAQVRLVAGDAVQLAIATADLDGGTPAQPRIITPADQRLAEVGRDNWRRSVRTILGPEHAAGRLLLGETINPPGNWSSYPPHKHDEHRPPREVALEEVYLFRIDPPGGFGVQMRYDAESVDVFTVRDGDVAVIRSGYHPVVAAPGYALYYLWVMGGRGRQMIPYMDPAHAWVAEPR
jgi:5-deoxy-glucuronate isomerase